MIITVGERGKNIYIKKNLILSKNFSKYATDQYILKYRILDIVLCEIVVINIAFYILNS